MTVERAFVLDRFQLEAIAAVNAGRSVLVAAPTSSGKTVVALAAARSLVNPIKTEVNPIVSLMTLVTLLVLSCAL